MSENKDSILRFRLKKMLDLLASKEGRHTELISLYIPHSKQISDVINNLRAEGSTASNIKSKSTRKNVTEAIEKVMQRLRLFKETPPKGLVIFCGAITQNGLGSEKLEIYVVEPPEPTSIYYYRCDQKFHLEPLQEMLKEKRTFGIFVIDGKETTIATLSGVSIKIVKEVTSGIPGKHRAGGQSAKRFERLREAEVNLYYKRVSNYVNDIFLSIPELEGIIVGGPGPTKFDFMDKGYLHYTLNDKVLSVVDTAYTGKGGLDEVVDKSQEILEEVRYVKEKKLVQAFLYELGNDSGLATYGETEVRNSLYNGIVKILLISENFEAIRVVAKCSNCDFIEKVTLRGKNSETIDSDYADKLCPNCSVPNLTVIEKQDVIDELSEIAEQLGSEVEIISSQTEEGLQLQDSFGGIGAILRYKPT